MPCGTRSKFEILREKWERKTQPSSSQIRPHLPRAPKNLPLSSAVRAKQVLGPRGAILTFPLLKTRPHHHQPPPPPPGTSDAVSLGPGTEDCGQPAFGSESLSEGATRGSRRLKVEARPSRRGRGNAALTHPLRLSGQLWVSVPAATPQRAGSSSCL